MYPDPPCERYREPGEYEAEAIKRAIANLGGREYTKRDAVSDLLRYADLTNVHGTKRPGPGMRSVLWRQRVARRLALAIRGVP